ncbi:MAG: dephospho-CoA kinase [Rhodoferax sp.]|nr:dephospho-CoA kinase [Rhodoferax sp.]
MPAPVRLGLTGGIGSGKSTVAGLLVGLGAGLVDADAISRQLTAVGGLAMSAIAATFGSDFVDASGALARDRMRQLVHTDASARIRLEAIIHPLVGQESRRQAALLAEQACPCIVFDVPLLVESAHWRGDLDHVLVVDCTTEKQIDRVMARNQLSRAEVEKIIASQASRRLRLAAADSVIFNVGLSLDELAVELQQISARFGLSSG